MIKQNIINQLFYRKVISLNTHLVNVDQLVRGDTAFAAVDIDTLSDYKKFTKSIFKPAGFRLSNIFEHEQVVLSDNVIPLKQDPVYDLASMMDTANSVLGAATVQLSGAQTGTSTNYKEVKTGVDGAAIARLYHGYEEMGKILFEKYGIILVVATTEGSPGHRKPGEKLTGNPAIPIGTMFPSRKALEAKGLTIQTDKNGLPYVDGYKTMYVGADAVECTELMSLTPEDYLAMAKLKAFDNSAACVTFMSDQMRKLPDKYLWRVVYNKDVQEALTEKGLTIDATWEPKQIFETIANAMNVKKLSDLPFCIAILDDKETYKLGDDGKPIEGTATKKRPYHTELLKILRDLGVPLFTYRDGDTLTVPLICEGGEVVCEDGQKREIGASFGGGGVFEGFTMGAIVSQYGGGGVFAPACKDGMKQSLAQRFALPQDEIDDWLEAGFTNPAGSSFDILDVFPEGSKAEIRIAGLTDSPDHMMPYFKAPYQKDGKYYVTVKSLGHDGVSRTQIFELEPLESLAKAQENIKPVVVDIMSRELKGDGNIFEAINNLKDDRLASFKKELWLYLYSCMQREDKGNYALIEEMITGAVQKMDLQSEDIKALKVLQWLADNKADWFTNPEVIMSVSIPDEAVNGNGG